MELTVQQKYKQTIVGLRPEDWDVVPLSKICMEIGDGIHSTPKYVDTSDYYFVNGNNLVDGNVVIDSDTKCFSQIEYESLKKNLNRNTILMSINGTIGNLAFYNDEQIVLGKSAAYISLKGQNGKYYIYYLLQHSSLKNYFADELTGSTIKNLSLATLRNAPISLPSKIEQTAIATALSDTDALISGLEKLISKKRNIKQGTMQELLRPKEEWEVKNLRELLVDARLGGNYQNIAVPTDFPLIKMGNIGRGYINLEKLEYIANNSKISEQDSLKYGDLLFNTRNTLELVGKVAIWRNELPIAHYNSNLMKLTFQPKYVLSNFLMNALFNSRSIISQLRDIATGTTSVAAIYTRDLMNVIFQLPPLEQQSTIVKTLFDMDTEIEMLERKLAKYKEIKQGMMQVLLTGKVRLI